MRDYADVLKQARTCANRKYCDLGGNCKYYDLDVCCQGGEKDILQDAADAIEELQEEKAKLENSGKLLVAAFDRLKEKVPHWISVEDELPSRYETVLLNIQTCKDSYVTIGDYEPNELRFRDFGDRNNQVYCGDIVTHWMPLPEAPKEVE